MSMSESFKNAEYASGSGQTSIAPPATTPTRMNQVTATGARVYYWDGAGRTRYGRVLRVVTSMDGTVLVEVRLENGDNVTLPATSVTRIT
ncbi:hypothetical protein FB45DRAFT_1064185 [Roridomyces roridus]|uniref:Uncharacterized protein n=1 Tax=Roridomyces roridus TaxID=1738132 RepID=A0AAD7FER7_9AGAR|nr:hypothetical protein FB45DRAFT_1064185 [Roridomyces roridus]